MPDGAVLGDVAALGGVDRIEVADAFPVLGILPDADVDPIVVDHRSGDEIVARAHAAERPLGVFRIAVEPPELFAGLGLERIEDAVTAREDHLRNPADNTVGRVRPGAVEDLRARSGAFPNQLAGVLVDRDEARRQRRRDGDVPFVDSVAGNGEDQVADDERATDRQVVGEDVELTDHVELPDYVFVDVAGVLLVLVRAVVLAVAESLGVRGDQLGFIGDVVEPVSLDIGRRAHTLKRPVVNPAGGQLVVGGLPEELAGLGVERHHVAAIAGEVRVAQAFVVGAGEQLAAGDHRAAVALRA